MWQCVTVSATSEGGQQFLGSLFGQWIQYVERCAKGLDTWSAMYDRINAGFITGRPHSARGMLIRKSIDVMSNCKNKLQ